MTLENAKSASDGDDEAGRDEQPAATLVAPDRAAVAHERGQRARETQCVGARERADHAQPAQRLTGGGRVGDGERQPGERRVLLRQAVAAAPQRRARHLLAEQQQRGSGSRRRHAEHRHGVAGAGPVHSQPLPPRPGSPDGLQPWRRPVRKADGLHADSSRRRHRSRPCPPAHGRRRTGLAAAQGRRSANSCVVTCDEPDDRATRDPRAHPPRERDRAQRREDRGQHAPTVVGATAAR